ncbi:hypothetical protein [Streptomyces sp. NRRL S-87]|uniref:hypothetical protein n=1 Tax=Streptomyces sp. NRRL S-87 TaxID=1463920 RepID=UPI000ABADD63|nr:hypothetical protein [Streptomyces sp. NRRL S-87]
MALSSPGTGTSQAAPSPRPGTGRGLRPLLLVGNTAMYALYVGVAGVLLALQVEKIDPAAKVANFGLIGGVSALFATVFNPVAGAPVRPLRAAQSVDPGRRPRSSTSR